MSDEENKVHARKDGPEEQPVETVNHPKHYMRNGIECIDVIEEFNLDFDLGCALKYIVRCDAKATKEENLKKAAWYIQHRLDHPRDDHKAFVGKLGRVVEVSKAWRLPFYLELAVYNILLAKTMESPKIPLSAARAYLLKELAGGDEATPAT
jgi:hypothetical protein